MGGGSMFDFSIVPLPWRDHAAEPMSYLLSLIM